jgi:hypothetical protein
MKRINIVALLVVVAFLGAVLLAAAYGAARKRQRDEWTCLRNMLLLDSAVFNIAMRDRYYRGDIVPLDEVSNLVARGTEVHPGETAFTCPSGGHYVIPLVGGRTTCSKHGDLLAEYYKLLPPPRWKPTERPRPEVEKK